MRTKANFIRNAALTSLFALCASSTVFAQTSTPATGLGQAWPNAADQSASPNWHVYVFVLNGVKYIQVNDLNGTVHAAVGAANGASIVLPMGTDAQNVTTSSSSSSSSSSASSASTTATTVYSDSTTTVTATPQSNGTTKFNLAEACTGFNCSGSNVSSGSGL
jgi:hypothetical protein